MNVATYIAKMRNAYEKRYLLTQREYMFRISELALHKDFEYALTLLSKEKITYLKNSSKRAASHPDDYVGCQLVKARTYWIMNLLHDHFHPGKTKPEFKRYTPIGKIAFSYERDENTVLVGKDDLHLSYRHYPLLLTHNNQHKRIFSFDSLLDKDERSKPKFRWGVGVILIPSQLVHNFPLPGSTIWTDRTIAPKIPPLEQFLTD